MENATKALIIAATVLIAILIISVGIYVFLNYSQVSQKYVEDRIAQEMIVYNKKFYKYKDKELKFQDVVTIANLANDYNERGIENNKITVRIGNKTIIGTSAGDWDWQEELTKKLNDDGTEVTYEIQRILHYYDENNAEETDEEKLTKPIMEVQIKQK